MISPVTSPIDTTQGKGKKSLVEPTEDTRKTDKTNGAKKSDPPPETSAPPPSEPAPAKQTEPVAPPPAPVAEAKAVEIQLSESAPEARPDPVEIEAAARDQAEQAREAYRRTALIEAMAKASAAPAEAQRDWRVEAVQPIEGDKGLAAENRSTQPSPPPEAGVDIRV